LLKGQLSFLNNHYDILAASGGKEELMIIENREGVRTANIAMKRTISFLSDIKSLFCLYKLFRAERPMVVHSITPKAGLLSMTAAYFAGVPIRMHTFTGLIFPTKRGVMKRVLILMDKVLCRFATNVYPEGEGVKRDLISYKITRKPLRVLANGNVNGIDLDHFSNVHFPQSEILRRKESLGITNTDFVFVFVGRLVRDKGLNELIQAFIDLEKQISSVKLILVGSMASENDPLSAITLEAIKHNGNIISVGYQLDVRPYMAVSDALVFPSYREGFPNVVIQAGSMSLPCIVSDINGCNEIIINEQNGLIVPVKDTLALCKSMKLLIENSTLRLRLQKNSRNMISERFEHSVVWKALLDEYDYLCIKK